MTTETIKERPILFSGPMVKAILSGAKTQTRRLMKPQPRLEGGRWIYGIHSIHSGDYPGPWCPYGEPGERLWVRETAYIAPPNFSDENTYNWAKDDQGRRRSLSHAATMHPSGFEACRAYKIKPTPSIHMPRWASRLLLQIESVKVERLQDISEADAIAEGVGRCRRSHAHVAEPAWDDSKGLCWQSAATVYQILWDEINGKRASWDSNPWVWVVSFKKVEAKP